MIRLNFFPLIKQDPFSVAAAGASGLLGLASGALSAHQQQVNTRENMLLQHALNKNEMNHSMQLQRSQQEWLMNNQYQKTVAGMKNAGLNPATANGTTPAVPSAGSPSSGGSGPAAGMPDFGLQNSIQAYLTAENTKAQTNLLDKEAKKVESETVGQNNVNKTFMENFQNTMDEIKSRIGVNQKRQAELDQNISYMQKSMDQIQASIDEIRQNINESKARENFVSKQADGYNRFLNAQIYNLMAHSNLLIGQNAREGQMLLFNMGNSAAMADFYDNNSRLIQLQTNWNNFLMKQDMRWNEFNKWLYAGTTVLNCLGDNFYKVATGSSSFVPFQSRSITTGNFGGQSFSHQTINQRGPLLSGYSF